MPLRRQLERISLAGTDVCFERGDRRVGRCLYHTACPTCQACLPIRVLVPEFRPTKSQRRVLSRWADEGRVEMGPASCSDEKLELYNRHKFERGLAQDDAEEMTEDAYNGWLVESCFETQEMRYYLSDRLVGVGIVDLGATAISSVYFYFDPSPEVAKYSPGVYSVLREIEFCRQTGREHLYLGLYVKDCSHLAYKADYGPHEIWFDGDWRRGA